MTVARKIIGVVVVLILAVIIVMWYRSYKASNSFGDGAVYPQNSGDSKASYTQPNSAATSNTPAPSATSNQPPGGAPAPTTTYTSAAPLTDSQQPNNPDGMRFSGGNGSRYQWYRQGNLTWRTDTQTGESCVAFATDDEWRKPRVYQNGCNGRQ